MQASFPPPDTPDTLPFIIREKDDTLTYIPDKVAFDLMDNLIKFLDDHPNTEIVFEEEKEDENPPTDTQIHPNTPTISFPEENLVDILTDESCRVATAQGKQGI